MKWWSYLQYMWSSRVGFYGDIASLFLDGVTSPGAPLKNDMLTF